MKTIIEIYDKESILNLIAVCTFKPEPEYVVFIGEFADRQDIRDKQDWTRQFLDGRGIGTEAVFVNTDMSDCSAIVETLFNTIDKFPDCAIEVAGGCDLALVSVGIAAENTDVPLFHYDIKKRRFADIRYMPEVDSCDPPSFTAMEMIELTHAGVSRHNHLSPDLLDLTARIDAREIWRIYLENRFRWHSASLLFQTAQQSGDDELFVSVDNSIGEMTSANVKNLIEQLSLAGLITNINIGRGKTTFRYKNEFIKSILKTTGAPLELFTYICIKKHMDKFSDCEIDLCVDWDGNGPTYTESEIDIIAVYDHTPLFISCKSGKPDAAHLNEIYAISRRLGGCYSKPVLMLTRNLHSNDGIRIRERAENMGVSVISVEDLCPLLSSNKFSRTKCCTSCVSRECESNLVRQLISICRDEP